MSASFDHFLARLHAQGREKADGFVPEDFVGLTPGERSEVRTLLRDALRRGDTTAVNGLAFLDGPEANRDLVAAVDSLPFANDVRLNAARHLWDTTQDARWRRVMLEYLQHPSTGTRFVALGFLQDTPPTPGETPSLARVVVTDGDVNNRALAAELLLYWLGVVPRFDDVYRLRRPFMQAAESGSPRVRQAAVDDLASEAAAARIRGHG